MILIGLLESSHSSSWWLTRLIYYSILLNVLCCCLPRSSNGWFIVSAIFLKTWYAVKIPLLSPMVGISLFATACFCMEMGIKQPLITAYQKTQNQMRTLVANCFIMPAWHENITRTYSSQWLCMYVCMYVCTLYVCMYVCMYACMDVRVHAKETLTK